MGRYDDRYRERINDYWHYRNRQDDYKYNQRVTDHQTSMDHFWIKDSLRDRPSTTISKNIDTISDPATSINTRAISNQTISNKASSISDSKSDVDNKLSTEIQR